MRVMIMNYLWCILMHGENMMVMVLNHIINLYKVDYGHDYENKISALYKLKKQSHLLFALDEYGKNNGKCIVDIDEDKCNKTLLTYMEYLAVFYIYISSCNS